MDPEPEHIRSTRSLQFISELFALMGGIVLLVVASAVCLDVFSRWLFSSPIIMVADLNRYNYAVAIAAFFPLCIASKQFVVVRAVGAGLGNRAANWLEVFGDVCTLLVFCALSWQFARYTQDIWGSGLTSLLLRVPQAPWWTVTTVIVCFCVAVQVAVLVRSVRSALAGATVTFKD